MCLKTDTIILQCTFYQFQYFITTCNNIENRKSFFITLRMKTFPRQGLNDILEILSFFKLSFKAEFLCVLFMTVYSQKLLCLHYLIIYL